MQVSALAEALALSRRPDGTFSLHDLHLRLSLAGLGELASAVTSLAGRVSITNEDPEHDHPWI